jgi:hypothetical protein
MFVSDLILLKFLAVRIKQIGLLPHVALEFVFSLLRLIINF